MIRILVADPDSSTRRALALLLRRKLGTEEIVEVDSVETLIRALAGSPAPPDLVMLDRTLYGSPAPETCRLLQRAYPHLTIILLSVNAQDAVAAKEAGAEFIYKGASPDEVIATLAPLLRKESKSGVDG